MTGTRHGFHRYVALGDSLTEGDVDPDLRRSKVDIDGLVELEAPVATAGTP